MILVTGASGRLGATLLKLLEARGISAVGVYGPGSFTAGSNSRLAVDLSDNRAVGELFTRIAPTAVINTAALTDLERCETDPELARRLNTTLVLNLAESCERIGAHLIQISTDGVFDGGTGDYDEATKPNPLNVYAATKLAGEEAALHLCRSTMVARTNFVGSPLAQRPGLAEWIMAQLALGKKVRGFVDAVFSPLHTVQVAELLLCSLEAGLQGLYHLASHDSVTKYEFAKRLAEALGYDSSRVEQASIGDAFFKAKRPINLSLDVSKIESVLRQEMPNVQSVIDYFVVKVNNAPLVSSHA